MRERVYLLMLEEPKELKIGASENRVIYNLETMLDNMINLLRSYGISEEEILDAIVEDTTIDLESEEEENE